MPRPAPRRFGSPQMTRPKAEQALTQLLSGCRVEMLAAFTAERLAGSYKVPVGRCAEMLANARARRAG